MSGFDLINQILNTKTGLSGARKLALLVLAHFSRDGICYPSMQKIAECLEVSEGQARRLINELVDGGFVKKSIQDGRRTNTFQINTTPCINAPLANMQPLQKCKPSENAGSTLADMQGGSNLYNEPIKEPIKDTNVSKKTKRATVISEDWYPVNPDYATDFGINNTELAIVVFKDWGLDSGLKKKDWDRTWQRACREWLPKKVREAEANMPVTPPASEPQYFEPANRSEILKVFPNRTDLVDTPWSELTPDVQQVITEKCKEL